MRTALCGARAAPRAAALAPAAHAHCQSAVYERFFLCKLELQACEVARRAERWPEPSAPPRVYKQWPARRTSFGYAKCSKPWVTASVGRAFGAAFASCDTMCCRFARIATTSR